MTSATPNVIGAPGSNPVMLNILAINDFHGQLGDSDATAKDGTPIGGAATLANYLKTEKAKNPGGTAILSSGDAFGASPPESSLLRHEPTIAALAEMEIDAATFGNHEFDRGWREAIRITQGDAAGAKAPTGRADGASSAAGHSAAKKKRKSRARGGAAGAQGGATLLAATRRKAGGKAGGAGKAVAGPAGKAQNPWPGSPFPFVSANIVDAKTGARMFKPYVIKEMNGVKVAFVGAVTKDLHKVTDGNGIRNVKALDPAAAINSLVPELRAQGVKTIVAFMHEGGKLNKDTGEIEGAIVDVVKRLAPEVDAVFTAHSHDEYAGRINGRPVVQGGSYAKAFSQVTLAVDPKTGDVVASSAAVRRNDERGEKDKTVDQIVETFKAVVAPKTERVVSVLPGDVNRATSDSGETAAGNLIAEAQRKHANADIGLMNPGGIRKDLSAGSNTWGKIFSVQPFANQVQRIEMTGAQIKAVLEQQFAIEGKPIILQPAGMRMTLDPTKPKGKRVVSVVLDTGEKLSPNKVYTVAANSFLADGGDGFTEFIKAKKRKNLGDDLDALVKYLKAGNPVPVEPMGRITLAGGKLPQHGH